MIRILITSLLAVAISGCSMMQKIEEAPVTSELVTGQITLRLTSWADDPLARAERVRAVVDKVQARVDGTRAYTLSEIEQLARDEINWDGLSVQDQELLEYGLGLARAGLLELIGEGVVSPDERVTISTLLNWIDDAAGRVAP